MAKLRELSVVEWRKGRSTSLVLEISLCGAGTLPRKKIKYLFSRGKHSGVRDEDRKISLCGAGVAHSLGKGEATGSNPVKGIF